MSTRFPLWVRRQFSTSNAFFTDHRTRIVKPVRETFRHPVSNPFLFPVDLKNDVKQEYLRTSQSNSPHLVSLPKFSNFLKGFRPNELTIFTGPTGSGKTTVLSQISLDLASQNMKTLWGSFEIRNTRLIQTMLHQIATEPIHLKDIPEEAEGAYPASAASPNKFEQSFAQLQSMPMNFMNVFGSTPLEQVLDNMERSVVENGTQLIILDNLQFMLSGQGTSNFDKFDLLDKSIAAVRSFCNCFPVHVVLVIHPRKELDNVPLGLVSVSGTAKATQEADNVIILQKLEDSKHRYLDLKKNRFDGDLGKVKIEFSRDTRLVYEIEEEDD